MCALQDFSSAGLPLQTMEAVTDLVGKYSTALVRIIKSGEGTEHFVVGTGTFVQIGSRCGILTACHVANQFCKGEQLGLTLISAEHNFSIPWEYVLQTDLGAAETNEFGPDLAFLELPVVDVTKIRPYKLFYNLSRVVSDSTRRDPLILYGAIGERVTKVANPLQFRDSIDIKLLGTVTRVQSSNIVGEWDYLEVLVDSDELHNPKSYGGTSGGGLWRVPLKMNLSQAIQPDDYILVGVAFYETDQKQRKRHIRCHGPKSIQMLNAKVLNL